MPGVIGNMPQHASSLGDCRNRVNMSDACWHVPLPDGTVRQRDRLASCANLDGVCQVFVKCLAWPSVLVWTAFDPWGLHHPPKAVRRQSAHLVPESGTTPPMAARDYRCRLAGFRSIPSPSIS